MNTEQITIADGIKIALRYTPPVQGPTYVWCCGFKSDMSGSKVTRLEAWATQHGYGFLAFDYSGHGQSTGRFEDGTISSWRRDTLATIAAKTNGPLILVGSSMGGWMALLAALALKKQVEAIVLIAPAPDFTDKLMWSNFSRAQQEEILNTGMTLRPSEYDAPYPITRALIEDGREWNLLDAEIPLTLPVRILQGMQDTDVPWSHALSLLEQLSTEDVVMHLIKDGDHRLSRDQDIARLITVCAEFG